MSRNQFMSLEDRITLTMLSLLTVGLLVLVGVLVWVIVIKPSCS